jgi:hypothetical protein
VEGLDKLTKENGLTRTAEFLGKQGANADGYLWDMYNGMRGPGGPDMLWYVSSVDGSELEGGLRTGPESDYLEGSQVGDAEWMGSEQLSRTGLGAAIGLVVQGYRRGRARGTPDMAGNGDLRGETREAQAGKKFGGPPDGYPGDP